MPWARHSRGGLMQVLVPGLLLWDLQYVCRLLFLLGCWGVRWGGAVLFPRWGQPGWTWVMVGLRPGLLRLV